MYTAPLTAGGLSVLQMLRALEAIAEAAFFQFHQRLAQRWQWHQSQLCWSIVLACGNIDAGYSPISSTKLRGLIKIVSIPANG